MKESHQERAGMNSCESIRERCSKWFVEASENLKREQLMFLFIDHHIVLMR